MKQKILIALSILLVLSFFITACQPAATPAPQEPTTEEPAAEEPAVEQPAGFDWKRFEGKEITLLLNEHPWTDG
ncbi:MAG: hypothetical protein GYA34_16220, partial [Chloroflexi bacterium]|nr:hypothetical protein [Chloroflexota bacterium]